MKSVSFPGDSYRHKGLRRQLTEVLREKGIRDEKVLEAINSVPRHLFLDSSFVEFAYQDKAFPIGSGQTISQPYTVAFQTELLEVEKGMKVLEVGTGSGYQSVVLLELGVKLFTIERQHALFLKSKEIFQRLGYKPRRQVFGDGYAGLPAWAPFDRILVTAGAPRIPLELIHQLAVGGKLVIPVGEGEQEMKKIVKITEDTWEEFNYGRFRFVPMLSDKQSE
ncbi:MAG: protein-L-isoaspartate(D-aspartate) O-methyltransferase [Bacteroidales bacterium]